MDDTLVLADVARKAIHQLRACAREVLEDKMSAAKADELADTPTRGEWTHDHPLNVGVLRKLGLAIDTAMRTEIYEFMRLIPQAARGRPRFSTSRYPFHILGTENRVLVRDHGRLIAQGTPAELMTICGWLVRLAAGHGKIGEQGKDRGHMALTASPSAGEEKTADGEG